LHYLQQTNTALATGTLIYVINKDIEDMKLSVYNSEFPLNITQVFNFLNCLELVCNIGHYLCGDYI